MEDAEKRISKLRSTKKDGKKLKKAMRDKNKEISSMRQELLLLWNGADPDLKNQIEQLVRNKTKPLKPVNSGGRLKTKKGKNMSQQLGSL